MTTSEEHLLFDALSGWPSDARHALLNALSAREEERADAIGRLYQEGAPIAELMIDLEGDPGSRITVVAMLKMLDAGTS